MKQFQSLIAFALSLSFWSGARLTVIAAEASSSPPPAALESQMGQAWEVVWSRFFQKDVQTFADYLSSYEPGRELAHLPTAEEVRRQYPNPCGYSTGMEDGMILGGAMLSIIADMYAVTGDERLRESIRKVFSGVRLCATVHGVPGYLARNVCAEDRKSVYINSSRDQYTHGVHGMWKYYHSPLADEAAKTDIRRIMTEVADRMIQNVTPENNYDFLRADGRPCPLGICRMWNVQAHEAARLPMIYAAAWDITRDEKYHAQWRKYVADAVQQSATPDENKPAYAFLQMQCSLEVLHDLEKDESLKAKISEVMLHLAKIAEKRTKRISQQIAKKTPEEMKMLGPDWRKAQVWKDQKGYANPQWGPYREVWHLIREAGEAAIVPLMMEHPDIPAEQRERLRQFILNSDYLHNSSCGIIYHLGAYWKARLHNAL